MPADRDVPAHVSLLPAGVTTAVGHWAFGAAGSLGTDLVTAVGPERSSAPDCSGTGPPVGDGRHVLRAPGPTGDCVVDARDAVAAAERRRPGRRPGCPGVRGPLGPATATRRASVRWAVADVTAAGSRGWPGGPGRRRPPPDAWCSGWPARGWWRPSGPSRSSSSGPPRVTRRRDSAVPAILGWAGPVVASERQDRPHATTPLPTVATWAASSASTPPGPTGLDSAWWSPLPASATLARRPARGLRARPRSARSVGRDHERRGLLVRHGGEAAGPPAVRRGVRRSEHGRRRPVGRRPRRRPRSSTSSPPPGSVRGRTGRPGSAFGKEERQRSSIYTTVETVLEPFADAVARFASAGVHGAGAVDPTSTRLAVGGPRHLLPVRAGPRPAPADAPVRSVVRQVLEHVYDRVTLTGRPLDPPLLVVLDEAANIAPLPDLDALAATAAGHGVQLVTVWHDLAQITRPVRSPGHHRGEQPPGQAVPVRHLGSGHPGPRQPADRRRGAAAARHHPRRERRSEHHPLAGDCGASPRATPCAGSTRVRGCWSTGTSHRCACACGPGSRTRGSGRGPSHRVD